LGKPYVWGASGPSSFDCSGLTSYVYSHALGKNIGRTTYQQINVGTRVSLSNLQPGDLIFWGNYHVGIYLGNNQYIHAPQPGQSVKVATISSYFQPSYGVHVK
ncbi:MAG: C40 family peptidase, partial [Lactobacillus sp.]|nr:C40 family peptidase [Lactobacillus sp.]